MGFEHSVTIVEQSLFINLLKSLINNYLSFRKHNIKLLTNVSEHTHEVFSCLPFSPHCYRGPHSPWGRSCSLKITAHMCELSNWFQEISPGDTGKLAFQLEKGALLKWAIIFTDRLTLFLVEFWGCFQMIQFHRAIDPNTTVNRMIRNCYF